MQQVIACDKDSYFVLQDGEEEPEEEDNADMVRLVMGGHKDDIVCIKYSPELSLIVTGTVSGELAVWDYEFSRLLDFLIGHKQEITSIHFLYPYPLMLTTSLDASVCIWKVREVGEKNSYLNMKCVYRF